MKSKLKNKKKKESINLKKVNESLINEKDKKTNRRFYFSYSSRIILDIFAIFIFSLIGFYLFNFTFNFENKKISKYIETSNLDYKVLMHSNEFYETNYLNKDMIYIANLIDKVSIDFDYKFVSDYNENIEFNYDIIGKIDITNSSGTKSFYNKEYKLLENKKVILNNDNTINIKDNIEIDYSYYNEIANKFKNMYGVDAESKLYVYMIISKNPNEDSEIILNNQSKMSVSIPLTQRAIEIQLDYNDINKVDSIIKKNGITIENIMYLIVLIFIFIIVILYVIKLIKKLMLLQTKKNNYDKFIDKILKEYDRLVVETTTLISFDKKEIIKINKFSELLDIHDNLQLPIMYYSINKHQKCYLYINHLDVIYLMIVKAVDLEDFVNEKEKI